MSLLANQRCIAFGMPEKSGGDRYNSVAVMGPNGDLVACYRKTHLWSLEHQIFKLGEELCLLETEFGTVGVTICYDACFPEFVRALSTMGATFVTHSTFWITHESFDKYGYRTAIYHSYCRTRAFENQVYFARANRVGNDDYLYDVELLRNDPLGWYCGEAGPCARDTCGEDRLGKTCRLARNGTAVAR